MAASMHTTTRTQKLKPLSNDVVKFVTVNSLVNETSLRLPGPPGWDYEVLNIGAGKPWEKYLSQHTLMQDYVNTQPDDQIVVYMDGKDIMYGGCDVDDFVERFKALSNLGPKGAVIFSAEYHCAKGPIPGCKNKAPNYPDRDREKVLAAFNLTKNELDRYR